MKTSHTISIESTTNWKSVESVQTLMGWHQHSNGSPADVKGSPPIENNPRLRKMATPPALQPTQHKMLCHLRLMWMNDMDRPTRHVLQISSNFFLFDPVTKIIYLNYKRKIKPESKRSMKINSSNWWQHLSNLIPQLLHNKWGAYFCGLL